MSKKKIQKYFKLQREIDNIKEKEAELTYEQSQIFLSKCKRTDLYINLQSIFEVFLKNPIQELDKWIAMNHRDCGIKWSRESLDRQMNKIFKILCDEKFIVRVRKGYYKLNPLFVNTVRKNIKKKENN